MYYSGEKKHFGCPEALLVLPKTTSTLFPYRIYDPSEVLHERLRPIKQKNYVEIIIIRKNIKNITWWVFLAIITRKLHFVKKLL